MYPFFLIGCMKLVTYLSSDHGLRLGAVCLHTADTTPYVIDVQAGYRESLNNGAELPAFAVPSSLLEVLQAGEVMMSAIRQWHGWMQTQTLIQLSAVGIALDTIELSSPLPNPRTVRDGYAFRQHVETARRNRGLEMIPEFDEIPIFYFTNPNVTFGQGDIWVQDMHLEQLDFELEVAIVIGKQGKNIPAHKADEHIAGLMVMNDWSARVLQMQEMKLNLGPAKGKDFANSFGPFLVTPDELAPYAIPSDHGNTYNLPMRARINGREVSQGNVQDMRWTFAQIIERASYGTMLYPGEIIGSGTCGTGCLLELNGSKVFTPPLWLQADDIVECEIDVLGTLRNTVRRASAEYHM
jgi:fumarylacetoacetate (FAA) hydrolase